MSIGNTKVTKHFKLKELWSPDNNEILLDDLFEAHMELLEELRTAADFRLKVNSGHRSLTRNAAVGGAPNSMHLRFATDLTPLGGDVADRLNLLHTIAEDLGFQGIGAYNTFIHLDRRDLIGWNPARWDKRT